MYMLVRFVRGVPRNRRRISIMQIANTEQTKYRLIEIKCDIKLSDYACTTGMVTRSIYFGMMRNQHLAILMTGDHAFIRSYTVRMPHFSHKATALTSVY